MGFKDLAPLPTPEHPDVLDLPRAVEDVQLHALDGEGGLAAAPRLLGLIRTQTGGSIVFLDLIVLDLSSR